ncbi:MAG: hypothetical protein AAFV53_26065 [Myxococcota bacterium]
MAHYNEYMDPNIRAQQRVQLLHERLKEKVGFIVVDGLPLCSTAPRS